MTFYTGEELLRMVDEGCDLLEICREHDLLLDTRGICPECEAVFKEETQEGDND